MDDDTKVAAGERFARSIAAKDRAGLIALLAPQVDFQAVTPGGAWQATTADEVADIVLGRWFAAERQIDAIDWLECTSVADRESVGYRFRATTGDGPCMVEQHAYVAVADGAITSVRIACSGFRPVESATL